MKRLVLFFMLVATINIQAVFGQEWGYGFKAGLNFSTIIGDVESNAAGKEIESFGTRTGFHVGGGLVAKLTDRFGIKAGILFTQKGTSYKFDGDSFKSFVAESGESIFTTGTQKISLDITNSYISIPIMGYAKPWRRLEFFAGLDLSFLTSSKGEGELRYKGSSAAGSSFNEYAQVLIYNYFKDDPLGAANGAGLDPISFVIDGKSVVLDQEVGAYYENAKKDGNFYKIFDMGLIVGTNVYINSGLYLGFTLNYGLLDVSDNSFDFSRVKTDNQALISRSDSDRNIAYQLSLGFGF